MKLTIGMPCHNDYSGVFMTVNALRLYHDLSDCEIVVVDNAPKTRQGEAVAAFLAQVEDVPIRYFPFAESVGPANAKNKVIEMSEADAELIIDCHVLLKSGVVADVKQHYKDNPTTLDLYHGPLYMDNLKIESAASHFNSVWSGGMLGQWTQAWINIHSELIIQASDNNGRLAITTLMENEPCLDLDTPYAGHERVLRELGWQLAHEELERFEIPAMGCGMFSCRREAWLGFHPLFREFGGEEWYIHEKYRNAGRKVWCMSDWGWQHRFFRDVAPNYPNNMKSRLRNYVIGHREFGLNTDELVQHFRGL